MQRKLQLISIIFLVAMAGITVALESWLASFGHQVGSVISVEMPRRAFFAVEPAAIPADPAALGAVVGSTAADRVEAIYALGDGAAAGSVAALSDALEDPAPEVRLAAVFALAEVGGDEVIEALQHALTDWDDSVRLAAMAVLDDRLVE
jgi:HEAT repeat protein